MIFLFLSSSCVYLIHTAANDVFNQFIKIEVDKHREKLKRVKLAFDRLAQDNISEEQFRQEVSAIAKIVSEYGNKKEREIYGIE